jgi:hypothetical protein
MTIDIADRLRQKGFKVHQEKKTITVKSKWFCSVIAVFSSSETKFKYKFGKIDRIKAIIGSLLLFPHIILLSLDSPFLPLYIFCEFGSDQDDRLKIKQKWYKEGIDAGGYLI